MANVPPTAQGLVFREDEVIRFKLGDVEYAALQGIEVRLRHEKYHKIKH